MYTDYWKLRCRPFDSVADDRFYYPAESHQATWAKLRYALENRVGAALIAGPSGIGKSQLTMSLCEDLPESFGPVVHLRFPQLPPAELLALLAEELTGGKPDSASMDRNLLSIQRELARIVADGRHAVVVIDEAHLLRETDALETVRLLMNYEPSWTLVLVAQPPLLPALERMPEFEERLSVQCLMKPFDLQTTAAYIRHRLTQAGRSDLENVFSNQAVSTIHAIAEGIPRRINRLSDLALLIGFAEEQPQITAEHVRAVAEELLTANATRRTAA
jgi:type II secretory pathway predicted ATPase ExeA